MFKKICMNSKTGKWTQEEDVKLTVGVIMFGYRWIDIAKSIFNGPNEYERRTEIQCRERWMCSLNPEVPVSYKLHEDEK